MSFSLITLNSVVFSFLFLSLWATETDTKQKVLTETRRSACLGMPLQISIQRPACTAVPDFNKGLLGQPAVAAHVGTHQLAWEAILADRKGAQLLWGFCCHAILSSSSLEEHSRMLIMLLSIVPPLSLVSSVRTSQL